MDWLGFELGVFVIAVGTLRLVPQTVPSFRNSKTHSVSVCFLVLGYSAAC